MDKMGFKMSLKKTPQNHKSEIQIMHRLVGLLQVLNKQRDTLKDGQ